MARLLRAGVFGTGALGRHHTRLLGSLDGVDRIGVYDPRREAAVAIANEYGANVFESFEELAERIDVAVVAAPTSVHVEVGVALLERGIHLLVEKPIAPDLAGADRLIEAARRAGRVLAVGHVEFHNPAVSALVAVGETPRYVEIQRLALFTPRSLDVDVITDLMIHDLQILHAMDASAVREVRATGIPVLSDRIDLVNARLEFESGLVANVSASRVSSVKVRELRAFYRDRYRSLDYQTQEIKGFRLDRSGEEPRILPEAIHVENAEPLRRELEAFVAACGGRPACFVDGADARVALSTALAVAQAAGGQAVC